MQPESAQRQPFERGQFRTKAKAPLGRFGHLRGDGQRVVGANPIRFDERHGVERAGAAQPFGGQFQLFGREDLPLWQPCDFDQPRGAHVFVAGHSQHAKTQLWPRGQPQGSVDLALTVFGHKILIRQCRFRVAHVTPTADPGRDGFLQHAKARGLPRGKSVRQLGARGYGRDAGRAKAELRPRVYRDHGPVDAARRLHRRNRGGIDAIQGDLERRPEIPVVVKQRQKPPVIGLRRGDQFLRRGRLGILIGLLGQQGPIAQGGIEVRIRCDASDGQFRRLCRSPPAKK